MDLDKKLEICTQERNIVVNAFNNIVKKSRLLVIDIAEEKLLPYSAFDDLADYIEEIVDKTQAKLDNLNSY